jgi:Mrp family chromosome partitioning ATPase
VLNAIADQTHTAEAAFRTSVGHTLDALRAAAPGNGPQIVMVTAAKPAMGVTVAATALAYAAARAGVKTLLVDASSANPALSLLFVTEKEQAEPCVLDSKRHLQAIVETDSRSGLALLPIALADLRTFSADQNRRFAKGLSDLSADYSLVIIDGGAVTFSPPERALAALVSQVIIVSRPGDVAETAIVRWTEHLGIDASKGRRLITMAAPRTASA